MWRGFGGYGSGMGRAMPWTGWIGPVLMLIFWALVITALVLFIRYMVRQARMHRDGHHGPERENAAIETLRMRYAKGEIGKEEFEERRKDLS